MHIKRIVITLIFLSVISYSTLTSYALEDDTNVVKVKTGSETKFEKGDSEGDIEYKGIDNTGKINLEMERDKGSDGTKETKRTPPPVIRDEDKDGDTNERADPTLADNVTKEIIDSSSTQTPEPEEYVRYNKRLHQYNWVFKNLTTGNSFTSHSNTNVIQERFTEAGKYHAVSTPEYRYKEGTRSRLRIVTTKVVKYTTKTYKDVQRSRKVKVPIEYNAIWKIVNGVKEFFGWEVAKYEEKEETYTESVPEYSYRYETETSVTYTKYEYDEKAIVYEESPSEKREFNFTITVYDLFKDVTFPIANQEPVDAHVELVE